MLLRSIHRTTYHYRTPSIDSHNEVRLKPLTDANQVCRSFCLTTKPASKVHTYEEPGGTVHHFGIRANHDLLEIIAEAEVETLLTDPFNGVDLIGDNWPFYEGSEARQKYAEFLTPSPYVGPNEEAREIATAVRNRTEGPIAAFLLELNHYLFQTIEYDPDVTHVHSTVDEVLQLKAGVCQDFAHLMIACCRSLGIPARYVSGYLYSGTGGEMRGHEAMHAWLECPMPDGRWLAFDPTNNLLANDQYVRVHVGRDYSDVTPTRGIYIGTLAESLEVTLRVESIAEEASRLKTGSADRPAIAG